jgi:CMP-N,N'-diacetyllegionaminic acid synthase
VNKKINQKNTTHALILARGSSKGIKNKNLIKIKNKPLVYWSISKSIKSKKIDYTWVSSDSKKILNVSAKFGAKTIRRPKKLAADNSISETGWIHAINHIKKNYKIKTVVAIQPTSPIRYKDDFDNAITIFTKKKLDSLFSCNKVHKQNIWIYKNKILSANYDTKKKRISRHLEVPHYNENGSFWIFNVNKFLKHKKRLFGKIGNYTMPKKCGFQIDDYLDLKIIKTLI